MNSKQHTLLKLLPKADLPEEKDESPATVSPWRVSFNIGFAVATALLLAFLLLPRVPLLQKGEIAARTIVAPFAVYVEDSRDDETTAITKINKGEVIVEAGYRATDKAVRVLEEIARQEGLGSRRYAYLGLVLLVLLILYLFYRDIKRYRKDLITDTKKNFLLALLLLSTVSLAEMSRYVLSFAVEKIPLDPNTLSFALPVSAGATLACLLFDFHIALGFSFIVSILLNIVFHGDPFMQLYYFFGSIVGALSVIHCKKRSAVLRAGALTGLVNLVSIVGIDLYKGLFLTRAAYDLPAGFLGGLLVSMIVSVSLPFFEAVFDIATDIKLLELLEPNQPLLKELVYKSPGTYHHSIVIGNLAEAAAEAIGENALLARVGAYYHDVGKIRKPEYFIENQRVSENKHDHLMPSMSSLIIASHVKDGVEIAREHKLPSIVVDIIQQHHGTSLITYFYQKAKERQPLTDIAEGDYRYQGPRPRTKIAAIVMLSDSVEAASRTLDDPTPERIQALTNSVINRIFLDDQLSKCDLTLKDLRDISRSFSLILIGIYHHRIDYPGMGILGGKKRGEHRDKKHSEEAKTVNGASREKTHDSAPEPRIS